MLYLNTDRLHVEITEPGVFPNDNNRFDWAGTVTEIILDKKYRFCATEPNNLSHPSSCGRGLTNEFKLDTCDETAVGEKFPKLGIGLLTKPDEDPYTFYRRYETLPYPVTWTQTNTSITFHTEPISCQGYAVKEEKTISVKENELVMKVKITNVGDKDLTTEEYCHNFLTIENMAIGPDYKLYTYDLCDQGTKHYNGTMYGFGEGYTWKEYCPTANHMVIDTDQLTSEEQFSWKLENIGAGAYIECTDHFKPVSLALWYADHMVALESFHGINLKPGESDEWTRSWKFEKI